MFDLNPDLIFLNFFFFFFFILKDDERNNHRTESVDLGNGDSTNHENGDEMLKIEISDALNEKDKVKFTVKTKVFYF
jgi:hypothetical protein